ncbi:MAG TPA: DUF6220 domain-containing protein [Dehalococcoidia bacterium]|jgi:hypothetical protein|nr:DUF6220 domain-containing protein [Dehalococcoidia bacterium]
MSMQGMALVGFSWLYVLGVVIQFFLAGLGILGGEDWKAHEGFGWSALHLTPILLLVLTFIAHASSLTRILAVALVVIGFIQPLWVTEFRGELLGAMHVVGALVIFVLAHDIARRATREMRALTSEAVG